MGAVLGHSRSGGGSSLHLILSAHTGFRQPYTFHRWAMGRRSKSSERNPDLPFP